MEKVETALNVAVATSKNLILYGAGGHGKSEYVEDYFRRHNIKPFTLSFGEGMTEERLWGGIDIPLFQKTGRLQYLLENSFIKHQYVVFEELFDAPTSVLLSLKDVLTSKRFRNGSQCADVETQVIIACTNRTAEEVGVDLSSKALLERFPLRYNVAWERYGVNEYMTLLKSVIDTQDDDLLSLLANIFAKQSETGQIVSPRTAIHAAQVAIECGVEALHFIGDLSPNIIDDNVYLLNIIRKTNAQAKRLNELLTNIRQIINAEKESDSVKVAFLKRAKEIRKELGEISVYDANVKLLQEARTKVDSLINTLLDSI